MSAAQEPDSEQDAVRRWQIPPPLLRDADSPGPEALSILREIRSEVGAILWKSLRSTLLWAEFEPEERRGLFDSEAPQRRRQEIERSVPAGRSDLRRDLMALLPTLESPEDADGEALAEACKRIAAWAEASGHPRTSLEFLQAGSLCAPSDARLALDIAYRARELDQPARAESWFQRALGLARQRDDWTTYILAYLGHGRMMMERCALPAARQSFIKAVRRAARQSMRKLQAEVLHELFLLESRTGNSGRALAFAREALDILEPDDDRIPLLARDLGSFWVQTGQFDHAFSVLPTAARQIEGDERGTALGGTARVAGQIGDRATFDWARQELDRWWDGPGAAEAWLDVARGATALGLPEVAEEAVQRVGSGARNGGEAPVDPAPEVLATVQAEMKAAQAAEAQVLLLDPEQQEPHDELAERITKVLEARSGA